VRQVLGWSPAELVERFPAGLPAAGARRRLRRRRASGVYEVELIDAQGDLHHVELSEVSERDAQGATRGSTASRATSPPSASCEEELRHAKEAAEAANRRRASSSPT
jgi:hypothetical protein